MNELPANFSQWLFTKNELLETPSILDGKSREYEMAERAKGCHFILAVAHKLNISQLAVVTATTFLHRFFMRMSLKDFHVYEIAGTCLFLAAKVEDCPRRLTEIVIACAQKAQKNDKLKLDEESKEFTRWKDIMLLKEVVVLETLCFDLSIYHPHSSLVLIGDQLHVPESIMRKAWIFLYQCLGKPLCVLYPPDVIAAAALLLAINLSPDDSMNENWYEELRDMNIVQVHEIAAEMLEYLNEHYNKASTSQANSPHPSQQIQHSQ